MGGKIIDAIFSRKSPLKPEIVHFDGLLLFVRVVRQFCGFVDRVAFDINRPIRTNRADILTRPATDAKFRLDRRNGQVFGGIAERNHAHRSGRAMFRTSAAIGVLRIDDAIVDQELDDSDLRLMLFLHGKIVKCPVGTDIAANRAIEIAKTVRESNRRLHEPAPAVFVVRGKENMGGTFRNTKLTCRTPSVKMLRTDSTRRKDRVLPSIRHSAFSLRKRLGNRLGTFRRNDSGLSFLPEKERS